MVRPLQAWLLRPLLVRARRLVAVSPFEAELFARRLRLPPSAFVVIPSGVDLPPLPAAEPTATPLILSIGRLESYKGHQRVVEALLTVNRARPGTRLRIVGTGPYEPQLRRLVDRLGLSELVEIAPVPADRREEMARLLQQARVVTMLSEYESQGLAIQEALALARPLVITQGTALADLERHPNVRSVPRHARGETVGAAIVELLDAPPAVPPPLPTWDDCVGALLEVYEEAIAENGASLTPAPDAGEVSLSAPPSVTVVVPTCRNAAALERALTSILRTGYEPLDVVVVENRPPAPATRALVQERFSGQPVRYLEEPAPGVSRARNAGLVQAGGNIVAFADDDVVVEERWVHNAVAAFAQASDVGCVTGRILPLTLQTPAQRLFDQLAAFDKGVDRRVFRLAETRAVEPLFPYVAGHIGSGANVFVRRDVALRMGGFDPTLGPGTPTMGGEDLDLFVRLAQDSVGIVYDPTVIILHDHPDSLAGIRRHAYSYGIGVTAMLAKQLIHGPQRRQMLQRVPAGVRYVLSPSSRKNRQKSSDYPRSLDALERLGMVLGPWTYVLSLAESVRQNRPRRATSR
jgi:GT2 family glycosyltransferase